MSDILFIKTSSLGDVIHQMPALADARRNLPHAHFSWVVEEPFAPLAALHPAVDEVIPVAVRRWRTQLHRPGIWREIRAFGSALRARTFQDVVDSQGLLRTAVMTRLARGRRHGYNADSVRERPASRFYDVTHQVDRRLHAIARNRALTAVALGYRLEDGADPHPDFGLDRAAIAGPGLVAAPYGVLLHATARPVKEWPLESWMEAGRILDRRGIALVLPWGTPLERDRSVGIADALRHGRIAERAPLDQVARLIAGASFVIGVDTGLLHLAAALGVPLVGIFLGSEPGLTGPRGRGPIAIVGGKAMLPSAGEVVAALDRIVASRPGA